MVNLIKDIRYALRSLLRQPGFAVIAVCSLALGIGANTAIFSLVNAVLLKPLDFTDPDRLVVVWENDLSIGVIRDDVATANFMDWKTQNKVFEDMAALSFRSFNITGDGEPEKVMAYGATANFFPLLGVKPIIGRNFALAETEPGADRVAILSYGLWQRRYGEDRTILGRDILLNGVKHTVIGVMPASFRFLQGYTGLWVPAAFTNEQLAQRDGQNLVVVGKLKPGLTVPQAQADISTITERIVKDHPNQVAGLTAEVVPLRDQISGTSRKPLIILLVAVGFVLMIACANVANLMLSRAASRRREIAVRAAVGASRLRIVWQFLTESIILAALGGILGLAIATLSFEFLKKLVPAGLAAGALKIDTRVLLFALVVSFFSGIVFGIIPALQASRLDLNEALKQGTGRAGFGGSGRLRGAFVVTEIALACVLLVGAGLLIQTLLHLRGEYSISQPEKVLSIRTVLPEGKYREPAKRIAFYDQVLQRIKALPEVSSVGYTTSVPLQWKGGANGFMIEGPQPPPGVATNAVHRQVSDNYLQTVGIKLRDGRYFDSHDDQNSAPVVIVNETMARKFWPGQSAIGKRIQFQQNDPWITIVGVVADIRNMGLDLPAKSEMYLPYRQMKTFPFYRPRDLAIRAVGDPMNLVAAVRREVHAIDPDQPLSNIATLDQLLDEETQPRSIGMILLVAFAALALLLAGMGIYAVLAYFVAQHRAEIGVRLAIGAQRSDILRMVLRKGMILAGIGAAAGLTIAVGLTRLMASMLFGVSPSDPKTFAAIGLGVTLVALAACYLPARRATKVDPLVALRYE